MTGPLQNAAKAYTAMPAVISNTGEVFQNAGSPGLSKRLAAAPKAATRQPASKEMPRTISRADHQTAVTSRRHSKAA